MALINVKFKENMLDVYIFYLYTFNKLQGLRVFVSGGWIFLVKTSRLLIHVYIQDK